MNVPGFTILTITLVVRHRCGRQITLHGDNWDDVHGICVVCDEEIDLDLAPGAAQIVEEEPEQ